MGTMTLSCSLISTISGYGVALGLTFRPATMWFPSGVQANVNGCSPTLTSPTLAFDLTSQNRTIPSVLQLASSFSFIGWNATRSRDTVAGTPGVRNSVEFLTFVFSGFHILSVLSAAPVATNVPDAFHDIVRIKCEEETGAPGRILSMYTEVLSFEKAGEKALFCSERARCGGAMPATGIYCRLGEGECGMHSGDSYECAEVGIPWLGATFELGNKWSCREALRVWGRKPIACWSYSIEN